MLDVIFVRRNIKEQMIWWLVQDVILVSFYLFISLEYHLSCTGVRLCKRITNFVCNNCKVEK